MGGSVATVASFGDPLFIMYDVTYMNSITEIREQFDVKAAIANDTAAVTLKSRTIRSNKINFPTKNVLTFCRF